MTMMRIRQEQAATGYLFANILLRHLAENGPSWQHVRVRTLSAQEFSRPLVLRCRRCLKITSFCRCPHEKEE